MQTDVSCARASEKHHSVSKLDKALEKVPRFTLDPCDKLLGYSIPISRRLFNLTRFPAPCPFRKLNGLVANLAHVDPALAHECLYAPMLIMALDKLILLQSIAEHQEDGEGRVLEKGFAP